MFFEGSEKKMEVVTSGLDLRGLGESFWRTFVKESSAEILSLISTSELDAYLLSESSLFVWDDRILILTCGNTKLVNSAIFFLKMYKKNVRSLIFQRKNEYDSRCQSSSFFDDAILINNQISGKALRLGQMDSHHMHLFYGGEGYRCFSDDVTTELLMYHIDQKVQCFLQESKSLSRIRDLLRLHEELPGFKFDDHIFSPFGYSLNGICDDKYLTVHISPQSNSSYVSFESNMDLVKLAHVYKKIIEIMRPASFDIVNFNQCSSCLKLPLFEVVSKVKESLANGYDVEFLHYASRSIVEFSAVELDLGVSL